MKKNIIDMYKASDIVDTILNGGTPLLPIKNTFSQLLRNASISLKLHFKKRPTEWYNAFILFIMGIQIERMDADFFSQYKAFKLILSFVTSHQFGAISLIISIVWIIALIMNGSFDWFAKWSRFFRSVCSLFAAVFWTFMAVELLWINDASPFGTFCAWFGIRCFVISLSSAYEVGYETKTIKNATV